MKMCISARERLLGLQEASLQACRSSRLCFGQLCGSHRALQTKRKLGGCSVIFFFNHLFSILVVRGSWCLSVWLGGAILHPFLAVKVLALQSGGEQSSPGAAPSTVLVRLKGKSVPMGSLC